MAEMTQVTVSLEENKDNTLYPERKHRAMKYVPKAKLRRWEMRRCEADHASTRAEGSGC